MDYEALLVDSESQEPKQRARSWASNDSRKNQSSLVLLAVLTAASIPLNIWLWLRQRSSVSLCHQSLNNQPSPFTGLPLDVPTVYHHHSDWWGSNTTLADELWENIDTSPMFVALNDEYVREHDLPHSSRFPWDPRKSRYFLKVFHELHCLKFIHHYVRDLQTSNTSALDGTHVLHCLDTLRQDTLCRADDTPMPTSRALRAIGDKQPLMCKNYDKLVEWIYNPERHACHRALDDYRPIVNSIERYAFCEKGSENERVMKHWFEVNGHRDPWDEGELV